MKTLLLLSALTFSVFSPSAFAADTEASPLQKGADVASCIGGAMVTGAVVAKATPKETFMPTIVGMGAGCIAGMTASEYAGGRIFNDTAEKDLKESDSSNIEE
ncbi:MAG: hypothetical protein ACXVBE_13285 [Bdellovibrionota bacterium]